jgi:MarR family transcriptional regulator, organic hydroperoxide resistance regulator
MTSLTEDLREKLPTDSENSAQWRDAIAHDRMAHLVKSALRALSRALQVRLNEQSVTFGHWTYLRVLWENDGITQRALSQQAGLMEPTTFAALNGMEKLGYISRKKCGDNQKKVYIFLTPAGRALKNKLVPLAEEVNEIALRSITGSAVKTTRETLLTMIENLARDEIHPSNKSRRVLSTRELSRVIARSSKTRGNGLPKAKRVRKS